MNGVLRWLALVLSAVILVGEINVIKNTTYKNIKEATMGFALNVIIITLAFGIVSLVEW